MALTRAEKREKQRTDSFVRAEQMHQARLGELPFPVEAQRVLSSYYIGCSGWFYWDWKECFYPSAMPTSQWFKHYSDSFGTVELNAPFYSWPRLTTVKTWIRQAGERPFIYTVKVSELITHVKRFKGTKTMIKDFGHIADMLGPRMGCFLFQLPPSFSYTPARLKAIIAQLDPTRRNVVEFRHASWWNKTVYNAFRKAGIIFCSCSAPRLPDELIKTADDIYVRFHGTERWYRHDYSKAELQEWVERIRSSGAGTAWIYFNNDYECHAIKNAQLLQKLLEAEGATVRAKSLDTSHRSSIPDELTQGETRFARAAIRNA